MQYRYDTDELLRVLFLRTNQRFLPGNEQQENKIFLFISPHLFSRVSLIKADEMVRIIVSTERFPLREMLRAYLANEVLNGSCYSSVSAFRYHREAFSSREEIHEETRARRRCTRLDERCSPACTCVRVFYARLHP